MSWDERAKGGGKVGGNKPTYLKKRKKEEEPCMTVKECDAFSHHQQEHYLSPRKPRKL